MLKIVHSKIPTRLSRMSCLSVTTQFFREMRYVWMTFFEMIMPPANSVEDAQDIMVLSTPYSSSTPITGPAFIIRV